MLGIILGAYTCKYLYVSRMNWIYSKPQGHLTAPCQNKVKTAVNKFKPNVWTRYDWSVFSSFKRYTQILFYISVCLGIDLMNFFMKFILLIPANHKLLPFRLLIWAVTSIAATKEFYEFITNKQCKRFGSFIWLGSLCLAVEYSLVFKLGAPMFKAPFPWYVQLIWAIIGSLVVGGGVYSYMNEVKNKEAEPVYDP